MSRAGDVLENPVTGEWAVVRLGTEDSGDGSIVVELVLKPGGAVAGEHFHPIIEEWFTVLGGRVAFRLDGRESIARVGERMHVPAGMAHDFWNAGDDEEARVIVEVSPAERFEAMISNLFGLARDGKTNAKGMPNILELAAFAREFEDVVRFTKPPRIVQKIIFGILVLVAKLLGYRGSYAEYIERGPDERIEVAPWMGRPTERSKT